MFRVFILAIAALCFSSLSREGERTTGTLELRIQNVSHAYGTIWVGIYDSEQAFLDKAQATLVSKHVINPGTQYLHLPNMPYGDYAVALFHDLNGNDELDLNWVGIPVEPFAFSQPLPSRWRLPRFTEVKVHFAQPYQKVTTALTTW